MNEALRRQFEKYKPSPDSGESADLMDIIEWTVKPGSRYERIARLLRRIRDHGVEDVRHLKAIPDRVVMLMDGVGSASVAALRKAVALHEVRNELPKFVSEDNEERAQLVFIPGEGRASLLNISDFGPCEITGPLFVGQGGGVARTTIQVGLLEGGGIGIGLVVHGEDCRYHVLRPVKLEFVKDWNRVFE